MCLSQELVFRLLGRRTGLARVPRSHVRAAADVSGLAKRGRVVRSERHSLDSPAPIGL